MRIPILDAGHGGLINGVYQTKGKRHSFKDGTTIFEGEFNRAIKARIMEGLALRGLPFYDLNPEPYDLPRSVRIQREKRLYKRHKGKTFLFSIHANAASSPSAHGSEVFTAKNASDNSYLLAYCLEQNFKRLFPHEKWRGIKRKDFDLVALTASPAVLAECFFMTNRREVDKFLLSKKGRDRVADWLLQTIISFMTNLTP